MTRLQQTRSLSPCPGLSHGTTHPPERQPKGPARGPGREISKGSWPYFLAPYENKEWFVHNPFHAPWLQSIN